MGVETVRYRSAEFMASDTYIELWMLEVVRQIDISETAVPWLKEMRDDWHLQATAGFGFGPCPELDRVATTQDRRAELLRLFDKAMASLKTRGRDFTPAELYAWGVGGTDVYYSTDVPLDNVIRVGEQFIELVSQGED